MGDGPTFIFDEDDDAIDGNGFTDVTITDNTFQLANPTADSDHCFQVEVDGTTVATIQMNNNFFTGSTTGSSSHENALFIETDNTSQTTVTATGNMAMFVEQFLELDANDDSTLTGAFTGNTSDQSTDIDLDLDSNGNSTVTLTFDNNSFSN